MTDTAAPPHTRASGVAARVGYLRTRPWGFALVLAIVLLIANIVTQRSLLDPSQWPILIGTLAPFVLVALASTPPILGGGGGIDISVGPLATLINVIFVAVLLPNGLGSPATSIPILLAIGLGTGLVNGVLVTVVRLQPVIATLATFFVLTGIALEIGGTPVSAPPNWTTDLDRSVGGIPGGLVLMAIPAAVWLVLRRSGYVRSLYSVGADDVAAFSAAVNVVRVRIIAYVVAGGIAAVAGVALTALIQSSESSLATTYALIALAGVSLGGTSLGGGRGGLIGSALGAVCIFFLQQFLSATGASSNYLQLAYGVLLIVGVVVGARLARTEQGVSR